MTFIVSLSIEVDTPTAEAAAEEFIQTIRQGDVGELLFQVVDDNTGDQVYIQPDTGRTMDALEVLTDLRNWYETGEGSPLGL